jgi:hypothetical protein
MLCPFHAQKLGQKLRWAGLLRPLPQPFGPEFLQFAGRTGRGTALLNAASMVIVLSCVAGSGSFGHFIPARFIALSKALKAAAHRR